ncbi:MAG: HlyD family efflux transporter periplasmic adaptor subunit [Oscillospiraceae bacterium]|nr:HlyD family efflux transporter periplasmic adaptor subunit [Oscillospiraceae bacterium]
METKTLKREWVKNAAIIFLAVLLVLTFFSNTILNRSLPEAASKQVISGPIVAKVRGSGTVEANGAHEVKMGQTKEIRSVMVKVGDEVKTGDVLFVLGAGDSEELEAAKEALSDLQYSYQRAAIGMPNFDYTALNRALDNAKMDLDDAQKEYDEAERAYNTMKQSLESDPATKDSLQKLDEAERAMTTAYENLVTLQQNYDVRYQVLSEKVSAWQKRVNELSVPEPTAAPTPTTVPTATPAPTEAPGETPDSGSGVPGFVMPTMPPMPTMPAWPAVSFGFSSSSADAEIKPEDVDDLDEAKKHLEQAKKALDDFVADNKPSLDNARQAYESAKAKYDALSRYNDEIFYELVPYKEALDAANRKLIDAQGRYDDAWAALYYSQTNNEKTLSLAALELQQISEKIKQQQEKVKLLSGETEDQILANVNGIVQSISATAGNTVAADTVICTIEVPDMGHTISFSVTNDQARRLRTGDTATVSNFYWGNEIVATLTNIRTDPKNPQNGKVLTFQLEGDVQSGSELTLSVGSKSANYDLVVPNSAIKSDSNGSFVLLVDAKNSPLGSRYIAKRVGVEVLASDDNNSAIVAEINQGDFVITTSSAPIKSGDQVRLADG